MRYLKFVGGAIDLIVGSNSLWQTEETGALAHLLWPQAMGESKSQDTGMAGRGVKIILPLFQIEVYHHGLLSFNPSPTGKETGYEK